MKIRDLITKVQTCQSVVINQIDLPAIILHELLKANIAVSQGEGHLRLSLSPRRLNRPLRVELSKLLFQCSISDQEGFKWLYDRDNLFVNPVEAVLDKDLKTALDLIKRTLHKNKEPYSGLLSIRVQAKENPAIPCHIQCVIVKNQALATLNQLANKGVIKNFDITSLKVAEEISVPFCLNIQDWEQGSQAMYELVTSLQNDLKTNTFSECLVSVSPIK